MIDHVPQDLGAALKTARENAGVSLRHIADSTKLPMSSLKALEENRIGQLPGGIYRRAIVRAYAGEVGLDPQATLRTFLSKYPDEVPTAAPVADAQPRAVPRVVRAALSVVGASIPVLAGVFYFASASPGSGAPRWTNDLASSRPNEQADALVASASLPTAGSLAMMISVSAQTRLAVIADGREIIARQLEAGEVVRLSATDDVVLMGDNAGAVHFSINGRPGRTLGDDGSPLRARIARNDYLSWLIPQ